MKIKAAVAREAGGQFSVEGIDLADPNDDELLVQIVATGICHTDLSIVDQIMPLPLPFVLGHEGAGVVEKVGANVSGYEPGDHVVLTFNTCGACAPCSDSHPAYCEQYMPLNFMGRRLDGSPTLHAESGEAIGGGFFSQSSFATYSLAQARNAIKIRKDVPLELMGPLSCGYLTGAGTVMNVLKPGPDTTLAVFGTGAVGMAALMAAKAMNAGKIIAVDRVESRLALARELGASDSINTTDQDLAGELAELGGIDQGVDTSGVPALISTAADALKTRGTLTLLGASKEPQVTLNVLPLISGKVIRGVVNGDCDPVEIIPQLIEMYLDGSFPMDKLAGFYSLEQINEAVADTHSGKTIKPILKMDE